MKVYIERTKTRKNLKFEGTALKLLEKLGINTEAVIVARNGTLTTLDSKLSNKDEVKILSVISGG